MMPPDQWSHYQVYNPSIVLLPSHSNNATYLASFRVSTVGCHASTAAESHNLVGLALLNDELDILHDAIVDINRALTWPRWNWKRFEDARLFVHQNCLFLSHGATLVQLGWMSTARTPMALDTVAGSLRIFHGPVQQLEPPQRGKNFQYFTTKDWWVETWPIPHSVGLVVNGTFVVSMTTSRQPLPAPSFETDLDHYFGTSSIPRLTNDRGSACCVELTSQHLQPYNQVERLLVGISHVKNRDKLENTTDNYRYLSRLYAFVPTPPFDIVARSGFFCLGECPPIHFISGMLEQTNDQVLVAYGMQDCDSHFGITTKKELARLLFGTIDVVHTIVSS
jgi:hypothetical protein